MPTELATAYLTLVPSLKGAQKSIEKQLGAVNTESAGNAMGKKAGKGFSKGILGMGAVAGAAAAVASKAFGVIAGSMESAISRVDTMNNFPKVMQNLGYSSDDASKSIKKMSDRLLGLPTSLDSMTTMVQQIAPLTDGLNDATNIGLAFNDMLLASGKGTEDQSRAMQQYTQMLARGKPEMEDWKTLQEVMPGQLNQVAKSLLGASANSTDLYNAMKQGALSMDDFNNAILKLDDEGLDGFASFQQQAKDATAGIATSFANIKTAVTRAIADIIQAMGASSIASAINGFGKLVGKAGSLAASAIEEAKVVISPAFASIKKSVGLAKDSFVEFFSSTDGIKTVIGSAMTKLNGFFKVMQMGASPVAYLKTAFVGLSDGGVKSLVKGIGTLTQKFGGYSGAVQDHLKLLQMGVSPIKVIESAFRDLATTVLSGPRSAIKNLSYDLQEHLSHYPAIVSAIDSAKGKFAEFQAAISPAVDAVTGKLSQLWTAFTGNVPTFDSFVSAITSIRDTVVPVMDAIKGKIADAFTFIAETFFGANAYATGFATTFATAFLILGPKISAFLKPFGSISGILSGVATSFVNLGGKIGGLVGTFASAGGGIRGLGSVLGALVSPVGLVMGIVAALAAGFVYLMATNEGFRTAITGLVESIGTSLAPTIAIVGAAIQNIVTNVLPILMGLISELMPVIGQIITIIFQVAAAIAPIITTIVAVLVPILTQLVQVIVAIVSAIVAAVLPVISNILAAISTAMPTIQAIVEGVMTAVLAVVNAVWPVMQDIISIAMGAIQNVIGIITAAINGDWEGVWNGIKQFFSDIWSGIQKAASDGIDAVFKVVTGIKDSIFGFFSDAGTWLVDAGLNIMSGLGEGIMSGVQGVIDFVSGIGATIAANKGPKAYDLKLLIPNGGWIMQSLSTGIEAGIPGLRKTLSGVSKEIAGYNQYNVNGVLNDGLASGSGVRGVGSSGEGGKLDTVISLLENFMQMVEEKQDGLDGVQIVADTGALIGVLAPGMSDVLGKNQRKYERGF